jgi:MFS transporter, ACS family, pantothenate transporter
VTFNNGNATSTPVFAQYLQYHKRPEYKVWQINIYPTGTNAVQVVTTLFYAWTSDSLFKGARWPAMIIGGTVNIITYISLAIWDISEVRPGPNFHFNYLVTLLIKLGQGWRWTCYYLIGFGGL